MLQLPERIVLWDTEYTSWEGAQERGWSGPDEYKELVQLGAILFNTETLTEEDSLLLYIRPARNPILSDYFIALTHITQNDVDSKGIDFETAAEHFRTWIRDYSCYAYGTDKGVLDENFLLSGEENYFDDTQFHDVRDFFEDVGIDTRTFMSSTIPQAFGKENPARGHDALGDARSIAEALKALLQGVLPLEITKK